MSISEITYTVVREDGIYEILRVDGTHNFVVVQTNIRTKEKAVEACKTWQKRQNDTYQITKSTPLPSLENKSQQP